MSKDIEKAVKNAAGRPLKGSQRRTNRCVTMTDDTYAFFKRFGSGSASEGMHRARKILENP